MATGIIIDGYEIKGTPPPPNTNFPLLLPFFNGTWTAPQDLTPAGLSKPPDNFSKDYTYRNTFNWSGNGGRVEIYSSFSFTINCNITKPPSEPNPNNLLPINLIDELGNPYPNPNYESIPWNWFNDEIDEEIVVIRCTDISTPRRPRFLDHITLTETSSGCTVSGFYDMMPTGIMEYVDTLSSDKITTPRILTAYDITECPARSESEIFYWTNDLTYDITYSFELTTNKGTKRSYTTTQTLVQDWTRIRDWVTQHHKNPVQFVAAPSAYSLGQIIADSGQNIGLT
jgi:hypothetical protein